MHSPKGYTAIAAAAVLLFTAPSYAADAPLAPGPLAKIVSGAASGGLGDQLRSETAGNGEARIVLAQRRRGARRANRPRARQRSVRRRRNRRTGRIVGGIAAGIIAGIIANEIARADRGKWESRCRRWYRRCDRGNRSACRQFYRHCY